MTVFGMTHTTQLRQHRERNPHTPTVTRDKNIFRQLFSCGRGPLHAKHELPYAEGISRR